MEFDFARNSSQGTVTITHGGGDVLLSENQRANDDCEGDVEPNSVLIVIEQNTTENTSREYLWIARNGSGPGTMPLKKGDSVTLVEPGAQTNGDIQLNNSLEDGERILIIGRIDQYKGGELANYTVGER